MLESLQGHKHIKKKKKHGRKFARAQTHKKVETKARKLARA
jgi:hypothetical protein